jgi:cold shock CspA family protein
MSDKQTIDRTIGKVKWFNNKSGFGFITVVSVGDFNGKDIFAHYSAIQNIDNQYKYLVQGEYIEFDISSTTNSEHEHQATNITGILGGDTMCETRRLNRPPDSKMATKEDEEGFTSVSKKRVSSKSKETSVSDKKRVSRNNKSSV